MSQQFSWIRIPIKRITTNYTNHPGHLKAIIYRKLIDHGKAEDVTWHHSTSILQALIQKYSYYATTGAPKSLP